MAQRWRRIGWVCAVMVMASLSATAAEWSFSRRYDLPRHIKAVDFYDALHGAFVCDRATVGFTRDGGLTWTAGSLNSVLPPDSQNATFLDVYFLDPKHGWLCGENGILFHTGDGGETWQRVLVVAKEAPRRAGRSASADEDGEGDAGGEEEAVGSSTSETVYGVLTDIYFITPAVGWVSGDGGLVLHTTDGGVSWVKQNTGTNNAIGGVFFLNENQGIAVGAGGTILGTDDGGTSWRSRRSPTALSFQSLVFIGDEGWAVGSNGAAVHTADRGETWELQESSVPNTNGMPEPIWNLDMVTPTLGLAGAEFGVILRTTDGGKSWKPLDPRPTLNRVNDVAWLDKSTAVAVGEYGTVLRSSDAGATWDTIYNNADLYAIDFFDAKTAWAAGANGTLFETHDGGATWKLRDIQVAFQLFDIAFAGPKGGVMIGDNRTFLETADGGATWGPIISPRGEGQEPEQRVQTPDPSELALAWYAVDFADATHGWVAGDIGRALQTSDGGQHWISHSFAIQEISPNALYGVEVIDASTVIAVGAAGTIVRTVDGGKTWTGARTGPFSFRTVDDEKPWTGASTLQFNELPAIYVSTVIVVGAAGTIVRTVDGGKTWTGASTGIFNELQAVEFASGGKVGWIVGGGGVILKTEDGGGKWVEQQSNTIEKLHSVAVASPKEAWAVGDKATILHTVDGGVTWLRSEKFPVRTMNMYGVDIAGDGRVWACGEWGAIFVYQ